MTKRFGRFDIKQMLGREVEAAARRVAEDPDADIQQHLERIDRYSKLVAAYDSGSLRRVFWAAGIGVFSVVVVGLLWVVPVRSTRVVLQIESNGVTFRLAREVRWAGNIPLDTLAVALRQLVSVDAEGLLSAETRGSWLELRGGASALRELELHRGSVVRIDAGSDVAHTVSTRAAPFRGLVLVNGVGTIRVGEPEGSYDERSFELLIPEPLGFAGDGEALGPTTLRLRGDRWTIRDLRVDSVAFTREVSTGLGESGFVSTIEGGTITLQASGRDVALRPGDQLTLQGLQGRFAEITSDRGVTAVFEGTVRNLALGPPGFQQNLRPSALEYLYHQQTLAFLWTAAALVWGALWSIRRTVLA